MLLLLLIPIVVGAAFGLASGGRPARLLELRLVATWLLWAAFVLQVLRYYHVPGLGLLLGPADGVRAALVVDGLALAWLTVNALRGERRLRAGLALLAIGLLANLAVIAANGGMPFSVSGARAAGFSEAQIRTNDIGDYEPIGGDTALPWLADAIPVPPLRRVVSAGDLVLVVGIGLVVATGMRRSRTLAVAEDIVSQEALA
jgi:hypothetical protein